MQTHLDVHLFVDQGSLGHESPSGTPCLGTSGEDVDTAYQLGTSPLDPMYSRFGGHLLESGLVVRTTATTGLDGEVEGVLVDVLVEPGGDVTLGEETERTLRVVESLELSVVETELVAELLPSLKLRDVAVTGSGEEVLGTTTEEEVDTAPGEPGLVAA
jgi:hypothetical protein